ncbi:DinB family protein [candidate division KSB1 bacterium]
MNIIWIIQQLDNNGKLISEHFKDISTEQAKWKPSPDKWSMLEVLNHLYEEEKDDFRKRLGLLLTDPKTAWPPIDPERWAVERKYNARDLNGSMENFLKERDVSINWLKNIKDPSWDNEYRKLKTINVRAGDLLFSWVVHDLIHIRQLTDLKIDHLEKNPAYSTRYAMP